MNDTNSLLHTYKSLLEIRNRYLAFQKGDLFVDKTLDMGKEVLVFTRKMGNSEMIICLNFSDIKQEFYLDDTVDYELVWANGEWKTNNKNMSFLPPLFGGIFRKK